MKKVVIILISFVFTTSNAQAQETDFPKLTGPYLGQKPPGMNPELFAPDLLSVGGDEANITFTPDGMECCYTLWTPGWYSESPFQQRLILYSRIEISHWTEPKELLFNPDRNGIYPFFDPDGKRLYFCSGDIGSQRIMFVEKSNGEWRDPQAVSIQAVGLVSVSLNGNLYFNAKDPRIEGPLSYYIYRSCYKNGKYSSPEKLSNAINDEGCFRPYIAPDESYIIFDRDKSENNIGGDEEDLYISFREKNGEWMKAKNMGPGINTKYRDKRAFVTFDGKYLFFASSRIEAKELPKETMSLTALRQLLNGANDGSEHIYWVDAKVIDELKPDHLK
jgi:Tol biopolymer transport system component